MSGYRGNSRSPKAIAFLSRRSWREVGVWLAAFGLYVNLLLSILYPIPNLSLAASDGLFSALQICTVDGLRTLAGTDGEDDSTPAGSLCPVCPLCPSFHGPAVVAALAVSEVDDPPSIVIAAVVASATALWTGNPSEVFQPLLSRAPPSAA